MTAKAAIIAIAFACALAGAGLVFARDPQSESPVTAEQLMAQALAGDPSKEVNAQVYTFPPGAVLPFIFIPTRTRSPMSSKALSPSSGKERRQKRSRRARPIISRPMSSIAA